jgi:hypothetical protein
MNNDVLLDENYDLAESGDEWVEGDSDQQDVELLVILQKGELTEFPFVGFGIERRLKARVDRQRFIRELKVELQNDGFTSAVININEDLSDFKISV